MSENTRPLAVVNPRSGGGRAGRIAGKLRAILERSLGPVDWQLTDGPGHATVLARSQAREGRKLLIAVGGDGTLHEVVNGVLETGERDVAVGYVGQGTGGDFRRTIGVDDRLDAYVGGIASGRTRRIDAGRLRYRAPDGSWGTRWFINVVSAGMGGLVDSYVSDTTRLLGGKAAYLWASARALAVCPRAGLRCHVTLGGVESDRRLDSRMVAVCNGRFFGSGMHVAPMARPDDGRFEVVSLDAPTRLAFALSSRRIYGGGHLAASGTEHFSCDRLTLDLEDDRLRDRFLLDIDGEPLGRLPLEVEMVPGALAFRG